MNDATKFVVVHSKTEHAIKCEAVILAVDAIGTCIEMWADRRVTALADVQSKRTELLTASVAKSREFIQLGIFLQTIDARRWIDSVEHVPEDSFRELPPIEHCFSSARVDTSLRCRPGL